MKDEAKLYVIVKRIESLENRIMDMKKWRSEYGIDDILATPNEQKKSRTRSRKDAIDKQKEVVGFEDAIQTLKGELDSEDVARKVIAIHGMGGLGKTSLATMLYNSSGLRHFDIRAKVCVSNEYNIEDILRELIKSSEQINKRDYSKMDRSELIRHLQESLQKRYFIVIDDIWDTNFWGENEHAFPDQKNGSRIIITTRKKEVADMVDNCFVHQLRFLTEEEGWKLFCNRAEVEEPNQSLIKLGKEIVGKCGGLPLAIVVLSGLLKRNKNIKSWSEVKDQIWSRLKDRDSLEIEEILSLSFNELTNKQMKNCFLYLSRFPEDYFIDVDLLKLLWIGEEFISEVDETNEALMEDVAENYLNKLIDRNLIQIAKLQWDGSLQKCRVHDLVRKLAIDMAKEKKFLVSFDSSRLRPNPIHLLEQQRHTIYNGTGEYFKLFEGRSDSLTVRSLALNNASSELNKSSSIVELKEMKVVYNRFKKLRVLDLTGIYIDRIPEEIGQLVFLNFLGLKKIGRKLEIPPSIGKLKKLQTLFGSDIFKGYIIPREIWELKELRHIAGGDYKFSSMQICTPKTTKLQTLERISYNDWVQINTVTIPNVRTLSIKEGGYSKTLNSVANLTNLQSFSLESDDTGIPTIKPLRSCKLLKRVELFGAIKDPLELNFLPDSVMSLSLSSSLFTEDPMPTLGNLTNL